MLPEVDTNCFLAEFWIAMVLDKSLDLSYLLNFLEKKTTRF